ncbi:MAG TPA: hypothetical protein VFQ85_03885 [Mycobacteriales bacterium]|jgi:hypothetical protein|nr:hypothetical protein [Mycobacteriales bacterium]
MSSTEAPVDLGPARAADAARAIFHDPSATGLHEPVGQDECAAAVAALASCFSGAGGTVSNIVANARAAAQVLSGDRLQGLSEIVQNADDAGASQVRIFHADDALLAVHDGQPLTLRNVHALAAPWLTTKRDDAGATGRFGIGLLTLHALADAFELHSADYHLRLGDPTLETIPAFLEAALAGPDDTVVRVPLNPGALGPDELMAWCEHWDDSSLLFLRNIRNITFVAAGGRRELALRPEPMPPVTWNLSGADVPVSRARVTAADGRRWLVYQADLASPGGLQRAHKQTDPTTPVGVALPAADRGTGGQLFAGLPVVPIRARLSANAQFDPIASRQNLADSAWNSALAERVAALWANAVLDLFAVAPASAWALLPAPAEPDPAKTHSARPGIVDQIESLLDDATAREIGTRLVLPVDGRLVHVNDLAVEAAALTGIVGDGEIAALAGLADTLPRTARDADGRWRDVLAAWRGAGHGLPPEVTVADALPLAEDDGRDPQATLALVAAGVGAALYQALARLRCVLLRDSSRTTPPDPDELRVLTGGAGGLATSLGIADELHPSLLADTDDAAAVRAWLEHRHKLVDSDGDADVLRLLADAGNRGLTLDQPLADGQAVALRNGLEHAGQADWQRLGAGIGKAIRLHAVTYGPRGKLENTTARPADAYQPKTIDREPDSFAVAADTTPGLLWIAPRYSAVLRSPLGRAGLGAQRFLRLLGAETSPRLEPHPRLLSRYSDPRRGLHIDIAGTTSERAQALRDLQASYSLDDHHSPDLQAVLDHIARDRKATRRRQRAAAVLSVLGRSWTSLADHAQVPAAHDYNGWRLQGPIRSWWLWAAGSVAWLDNAASVPSAPKALRLRTPATVAVHGDDAGSYLHPSFRAVRADVLAHLGVAGEPSTRELVARLEHLRASPAALDIAAETAIVYQALADRARERRRSSGHLPPNKLRELFGAGTGLILTAKGWLPPGEVLRGPPVFGPYRAFVPQTAGTEPLWSALQVRRPDLDDCLGVLRDIAKTRLADTPTRTVVLEILRLMAQLVAAADVDDRIAKRLQRAPLLTSQGWTAVRPVYCVDDLPLATGIADSLPVWAPGGELEQFKALVRPLRLTSVSVADAPLVSVADSYLDDDTTELLHDAVALLREDLARNDPASEQGLTCGWDVLETLDVRIAAELRVSLDTVPGRPTTVPVAARLDVAAATLYLTDPDDVGRVDSGGRAVASAFSADHRAMSQAWLAAIASAREGRAAVRLRLAAETAADEAAKSQAAISAKLDELRGQVKDRKAKAATGTGAKGRATTLAKDLPPPPPGRKPALSPTPRVLVDPSTLVVVDPQGVIVSGTGAPPARPGATEKPRGPLPAPRPGGAVPSARKSRRDYTDLEKETVGLELVRRVLGGSAKEIVDLRAQHGVGADAVDELRQFYELKVAAGTEPDEIVLEDAQIRRALSAKDFFLVIVSGVEGAAATPRVRVVVNPVGQLRMSKRSQVRFGGIRQSLSLVYDLRPAADAGPDDAAPTAG